MASARDRKRPRVRRGEKKSDPTEPPEPPALIDIDDEEIQNEVRRTSRLQPLPPLTNLGPEHFAYVRSVVTRFAVLPSHWREDLVQEVMLEAFRSNTSRLDVRALLYGISRHIVYRWMARRDAEREAVVDHVRRAVPVRSMEDEWIDGDRRTAVHASLADLPEIFREVFVRAELEDLTMPDVVDELGIPLNTGYTRLHLARARFLEALQRYLARRHIQKEDLSVPVAAGAAALHRESTGSVAGSEPEPSASPEPGAPPDAAPDQASGTAPDAAPEPAIDQEPEPPASTGADPSLPMLHPVKPGSSIGAIAGNLPWLGGSLVAAAAVAVGVWLVRSPQAETSGITVSAEPRSSNDTPPAPDAITGADAAGGGVSIPARLNGPPPVAADAGASGLDADADVEVLQVSTLGPDGAWARSIINRWDLGRRAEARAEYLAFREKHPGSPYVELLRWVVDEPIARDGGRSR